VGWTSAYQHRVRRWACGRPLIRAAPAIRDGDVGAIWIQPPRSRECVSDRAVQLGLSPRVGPWQPSHLWSRPALVAHPFRLDPPSRAFPLLVSFRLRPVRTLVGQLVHHHDAGPHARW
jgi:hypothetical protein